MASYIERRKFLATLGSAAAWPVAGRAQPSSVRPLISILSPLTAAAASRNIAAFRSALRDLGYVEGRNLTLAFHYGDGSAERMPSLARELVALNPDVVVAGATSGVLAAYSATRTIPIVAIVPDNPVTAGFAQSIAGPGRNITGTWMLGDDTLVGLAVPGLARVGAMLNPDDPMDDLQIRPLPDTARAVGISIEVIEVRDLGNLDAVAAQVMRANVQELLVGAAPFWIPARTEVAAMAARLKLPAVYSWREFADAGGLMSYGPNLPETYRQSARLVDKFSRVRSRATCRSS
jgi:ABC-type uncharacterized transport system substrate-binding protein